MKIETFPVFVIRVHTGYAVISTPYSEASYPEYGLLLFSSEERAATFAQAAEIQDAEICFLRDSEELRCVWALQVAPVTRIAWDTQLQDGHLTTSILKETDIP